MKREELSARARQHQIRQYLARPQQPEPGQAIGRRNPDTGLYQVLSADGSIVSVGTKQFNSQSQLGQPVRATETGGLIYVDQRNVFPVEVPAVVEEEPINLRCAVLYERFLLEFGGFSELYIGGDREPRYVDWFYAWFKNAASDNWNGVGPGLGTFGGSYDDGVGEYYFEQEHTINFDTYPDRFEWQANLTFRVYEATTVMIQPIVSNLSGTGYVAVTMAVYKENDINPMLLRQLPLVSPTSAPGSSLPEASVNLPSAGTYNIYMRGRISDVIYVNDPAQANIPTYFATTDTPQPKTRPYTWKIRCRIKLTPNKMFILDRYAWMTHDGTFAYIGRVHGLRSDPGFIPIVYASFNLNNWDELGFAIVPPDNDSAIGYFPETIGRPQTNVNFMINPGDWRRSLSTRAFANFEGFFGFPGPPSYSPFQDPPADADACLQAYRSDRTSNIITTDGNKTLYKIDLTPEIEAQLLANETVTAEVEIVPLITNPSSCDTGGSDTAEVEIQPLGLDPVGTYRIIAVVVYPVEE